MEWTRSESGRLLETVPESVAARAGLDSPASLDGGQTSPEAADTTIRSMFNGLAFNQKRRGPSAAR
jgi:hypothetical protein